MGRLVALEAQVQAVNARMLDVRASISKHQTDPIPDLDKRILKVARPVIDATVDAAIKKASLTKP